MLIHISPKIYSESFGVELIDLTIPEFNLVLKEGRDLIVKTPYPNKNYWVVRRNRGQKHADGLMFRTDRPVKTFTVTTRWQVMFSGKPKVLTHEVRYELLDYEFDFASSDMCMWHGLDNPPFERRSSAQTEGYSPARAEPKMTVFQENSQSSRPPAVMDQDILDEYGIVVYRKEVFAMPTLEPERLNYPLLAEVVAAKPPLDHAYLILL